MAQTYFELRPRPLPSLLTIVVPIYNEEDVIPFLIERLKRVLAAVGCMGYGAQTNLRDGTRHS